MSALADEIRSAVRDVLREELPALLSGFAAPPASDRLLNLEEASQRLGLGESTVRKLASRCELPSVKIGSRTLFRGADLDAYTDARRRSPERVRKLSADATD